MTQVKSKDPHVDAARQIPEFKAASCPKEGYETFPPLALRKINPSWKTHLKSASKSPEHDVITLDFLHLIMSEDRHVMQEIMGKAGVDRKFREIWEVYRSKTS